MPIQERCRILDHQEIAPRHFKLTLASPYIATHARPGQFVNIRCSATYDPLLRRPISLHRVNKEHQQFELLYKVVGKGTELLSRAGVGSELDILGPLGNGFQIDPDKQIHLLVGGGLGIAPLRALADQLKNDKSKKNAVYLLSGHSSKDCIVCEQDLLAASDQLLFSTDDGSYGKKGFVSDILLDLLANTLVTSDQLLVTIYACGPTPMLKAIAEIAFQKKLDCQISLEQKMACGIGTCLGCVIETKAGYQKVCDDGPVFEAGSIKWSA